MIVPSSRFSFRLALPLAIFLLIAVYHNYTPSETWRESKIPVPPADYIPSLHLIGDSSMCKGGTNNGEPGVKYEGWGEFVKDYVTIPVYDHAVSGRSARMYTREGRFDKVLNQTNAGDYVVIQFGRNEKGTLSPKDNGKAVCPGANITGTCEGNFENKKSVVLTFGGYMANATSHFLNKGANVIIVSPSTNNAYSFSSDRFFDKPNEWVKLSKDVAEYMNVTYVDHFGYSVDLMRRLGKDGTQEMYPVKTDRGHTNPYGADMMAKAFMRGLACTDNGLAGWINSTAFERVTGDCL